MKKEKALWVLMLLLLAEGDNGSFCQRQGGPGRAKTKRRPEEAYTMEVVCFSPLSKEKLNSRLMERFSEEIQQEMFFGVRLKANRVPKCSLNKKKNLRLKRQNIKYHKTGKN